MVCTLALRGWSFNQYSVFTSADKFDTAAATADNSDINLELVDADGEDGKYVLAHSAAHVLGLALEREFGEDAMLADGPPVNNGISTMLLDTEHGQHNERSAMMYAAMEFLR